MSSNNGKRIAYQDKTDGTIRIETVGGTVAAQLAISNESSAEIAYCVHRGRLAEWEYAFLNTPAMVEFFSESFGE